MFTKKYKNGKIYLKAMYKEKIMGEFLVNLFSNWDYVKIIVGYIVCIILFLLGMKNKSTGNKIIAGCLAVLITLFYIAKKLNI